MSLDNWRSLFGYIEPTIFDIIESAIRVAIADHPDELAARRDQIAEVLYTSVLRHCDRAADEQCESSSEVTTATTMCADGTEGEADVPGTPGASFIGKEFDDADDNFTGDSAANSVNRCEFDDSSASKPNEEQVPAQSIRPEDTSAKRKREDAANESPEPRDVPNKNPKPASREMMKRPHNS